MSQWRGSCLAGPSRQVADRAGHRARNQTLLLATLDHQRVREERHNFDPAGHYARPDVTQLILNRRRQTTLMIEE